MLDISNVGLQIYTLRDYFKTNDDAIRTLTKVRNIGYETIQLHVHPINIYDLKKMIDHLNITVCGMDVPLSRLQNDLERVLEECRLLNCKYITGSYTGDKNAYADGVNGYIEIISGIGEKLKGSGCFFAYHNHSFELIKQDNRPILDIFYEKTGKSNILAEIDTYWIQHGGGDPAAWIEKLKNRIPIIHLKDMVIEIVNGKSNQVFSEVGNGNINWESVFKSAEESGVEWYIVEQDFCNKDPFESVKESYEYLKSVLG